MRKSNGNQDSDDQVAAVVKINAMMDRGDNPGLKALLGARPELMTLRCYNAGDSGLLTYAAATGNTDMAAFLVEHGADINEHETYRHTPLHQAAEHDQVDTVTWCLAHGALIDGPEQSQYTPLFAAVTVGNFAVVKLLVSSGADVNRLNIRSKLTPLDMAILRKHADIEALLRAHHAVAALAPINWPDPGGGIPEFVEENFGRILPEESIRGIARTDDVRIALANKEKNKLVFTRGLFALHKPPIELVIVLPSDWNMYDTRPDNQFPLTLLVQLKKAITGGLKIEEGDCVLADEPQWKPLAWPADVAGFQICDNELGVSKEHDKDITPEEKVVLMTLVPIKHTKSGFSKPALEKNRVAGWAKITLKMGSE